VIRHASIRRQALRLAAILLSVPVSLCAQQPAGAPNVADLDLEQLAQVRVTSVGRRPEALAEAAAAIFVITQDDIRRSGATSLPEVLRLAPGLEVLRSGARDWAVSARGFNDVVANKLLVLIDGRAAYSPLFAGVFWEVQELALQDIERIEVILGPGATLWGSNAVNGVISVTTKSAEETRGGFVSAYAGAEDRIGATARYGGELTRRMAGRAYAKYFYRDPAALASGADAIDDWRMGQGGFRLDARGGARDAYTLQGDIYVASGGERQQLPTPTPPYSSLTPYDLRSHGGNVLGRWTRTLSSSSDFAVQAYFDRTVREQPPYLGTAGASVGDVDVQHRFSIGAHHDIVWGGGARFNATNVTGAFPVSFVPTSRTTHHFTGFLQDDIALGPGRWHLTLGTKLEHNNFSGLEVQPNVRLLWQLTPRHSLWSAVSRAVRIPSRVDADVFENAFILPGNAAQPPTDFVVNGGDSLDAERLTAYEVGYRGTPHRTVSVDVDLFYNHYGRVRALLPGTPFFQNGFVILPLDIINGAKANAYGGTLAANWRPVAQARFQASYTYLHFTIDPSERTPTAVADFPAGINPSHQAMLRSALTLPRGVELDVALRYVSSLAPPQAPEIPQYVQGDVRVGWNVRPELTIAAVGRDLFTSQHAEFRPRPFGADRRFIERRGYLQVEWQF
jgi:iron complex outermembrane receptor protein